MVALRGRCRSSPRHESAYHARLRGAFGPVPSRLARRPVNPKERDALRRGPANAAESRYDACRALRMRNWLKARVPSVYERLTGQRPWEELRRLRELQWRPAAELEARALEKLRAIV